MEVFIEMKFEAGADTQEILVAELSELGFESFTQEDSVLLAYTLKENYEQVKDQLEIIPVKHNAPCIAVTAINNDQNWNSKWEEYFEPVVISDKVYVRAAFHAPRPGFLHEIVIQPKMSFGTGHHETTQLMLELMLELDLKNSACLDMGCGTGVLAILAAMSGASPVIAIDHDEWCILNTRENLEANGIHDALVIHGDAAALAGPDLPDAWMSAERRIILSNITKNQNLENMAAYHNIAQVGTVMLFSGFYEKDLQDLEQNGLNFGMKSVKSKVKNSWCAALFIQQ